MGRDDATCHITTGRQRLQHHHGFLLYLQDPAKWVQLSCKKENPRQSSGAPMSPVHGHTIPSPAASCPPGQQCSPPHRVPRSMDLSSLLPLARERWQGMKAGREPKSLQGRGESPAAASATEAAHLASHVCPSSLASTQSTTTTTTTTDMCAMRVLSAVKFPRRHQRQQQSPSLS